MSYIAFRDPQTLGALAAVGCCLCGIVLYMKVKKRVSEEEIERQRRHELVLTGRIIDGTVLDISDLSPYESGRQDGMQLILYKYAISGVSYECSQDVTHLKETVDLDEIRVGFPCSVRYDTRKPENSIVVAEDWTGLRDTANSVPVRKTIRRRFSSPAR